MTGERVGWRAWAFDGELRGPITGHPWRPGRNHATCLRRRHPAPDPKCLCGIRATPSLALMFAPFPRDPSSVQLALETVTDHGVAVISRVRVGGLVPRAAGDDQPGTIRAAWGEIVDPVFLHPDRWDERHTLAEAAGATVRDLQPLLTAHFTKGTPR